MNKFVNVLVAAAVAATGALFAPTAQAAPEQQKVCYDITYVHEKRWSREVPGQDAVTHKEYKYSKTIPAVDGVKEYKYKKWVNDYKTKYQYAKQVRGVVQQKDNGQDRWHDTGQTFDWTWWVGGNTQWSIQNVDVLESGQHSGIQKEWTEGNGHKHWRWKTTEYRYVKNGETQQVPDGGHYEYKWLTADEAGWTKTGESRWKTEPQPEKTVLYNNGEWTTDTPGEPWERIDFRTVTDSEAVPGYTIYYVSGGDHTRTLGDSNWTTDTPEGWTFVDERKREVKNEIPCVNPPKRITKRFQVDTYSNPTTKLANKAASYDDDGRLKYGEDRPHYGHSRWQIVSVVGYDNWTKAQWITAVNKATTRSGVGNVTSTSHAGKVKKGQKLTVAWEIKKDSWPNKGKRGAQVFLARGLK